MTFKCAKRSGGTSSQWLLGLTAEQRLACKAGLGVSSKVCAE